MKLKAVNNLRAPAPIDPTNILLVGSADDISRITKSGAYIIATDNYVARWYTYGNYIPPMRIKK